MASKFMFVWAIVVAAYMVFNYRNKIRLDKSLSSVDWSRYKVKLSQSWWSGFLWASVVLTIFYFLSDAGLTR
ncbi:MAG: hypothetical protein EB029_04140 [Actinobacteria bacterium]|nr:hypothetical protein [Actinomycetota bacterium]NCW34649.1 hypothetical protein [Actinomycetota bacterium]NCZ73112.1 hypothetical protein [Actinomycetota bacterium]NDC13148.1 hypothetical protein [Actinomycetota bacterium]NDE51419.1 hypothetical protein [Actinomycetota bacterium]